MATGGGQSGPINVKNKGAKCRVKIENHVQGMRKRQVKKQLAFFATLTSSCLSHAMESWSQVQWNKDADSANFWFHINLPSLSVQLCVGLRMPRDVRKFGVWCMHTKLFVSRRFHFGSCPKALSA